MSARELVLNINIPDNIPDEQLNAYLAIKLRETSEKLKKRPNLGLTGIIRDEDGNTIGGYKDVRLVENIIKKEKEFQEKLPYANQADQIIEKLENVLSDKQYDNKSIREIIKNIEENAEKNHDLNDGEKLILEAMSDKSLIGRMAKEIVVNYSVEKIADCTLKTINENKISPVNAVTQQGFLIYNVSKKFGYGSTLLDKYLNEVRKKVSLSVWQNIGDQQKLFTSIKENAVKMNQMREAKKKAVQNPNPEIVNNPELVKNIFLKNCYQKLADKSNMREVNLAGMTRSDFDAAVMIFNQLKNNNRSITSVKAAKDFFEKSGAKTKEDGLGHWIIEVPTELQRDNSKGNVTKKKDFYEHER